MTATGFPQNGAPRVSVVIPTFKQEPFVRRALASLVAQRLQAWEAIVVVDGSPDGTVEAIRPFLADGRFSLVRLPANTGLGHALNVGLDRATAGYVAYLPTDDVWYDDHLASLVACLDARPDAVLAYAGVRHNYNRYAPGKIEHEPLQLVQALHRRTPLRWLERRELTTDDLDRMFWHRLREIGAEVGTGLVTCEWVAHPDQRHKLMRESEGGINTYRDHYSVREPLRFRSTIGNLVDEVARYARYRERPRPIPRPDGLKILLVGELAYNADRVLAFEERGHRLYGLWMERPYWYNTVGPLPFGHVEDLPRRGWREAVRQIKPDVIYALLNWQAVPFAHAVLEQNPGIPFVWHYKEGPFINLEKGTWAELVALYARAAGRVYSSPEMRDWFATVAPETVAGPSLVLDGDLPKREWFAPERAPLLSDRDGGIHTVVPGRPIGLHPETVAELAANGIHLHFYGDFTQGQWARWIERSRGLAPNHLHLHATVDQERWSEEFSRYDAGWLHSFASRNQGEIRRADWDDLNYPARMATLAAAGLPMIQFDNTGSIVATQTLARAHGLGPFYRSIADLAAQLRDRPRMDDLRGNVWRERDRFTFDHHVDRLVDFFRDVADGRSAPTAARGAAARR